MFQRKSKARLLSGIHISFHPIGVENLNEEEDLSGASLLAPQCVIQGLDERSVDHGLEQGVSNKSCNGCPTDLKLTTLKEQVLNALTWPLACWTHIGSDTSSCASRIGVIPMMHYPPRDQMSLR